VKGTADGSTLGKQFGVYTSVNDDSDSYYCFDVQFDRPVCLKENKEYKLVSLIKGPMSWYGGEGQATVESEGVQFTLRTSDGSNNATSISGGQFPALLMG